MFGFGDAMFLGSTATTNLTKPVVGIVATATGQGYWLLGSDGGIFAFGNATFHGSYGGRPALRGQPSFVAISATPATRAG